MRSPDERMGPHRDEGPGARNACVHAMHAARSGQHTHELKAAHHAVYMEVLADEASRVLDRTMWWSRRECTEFWEELNWELQAFSRANAKLELSGMPTDKRQAAHL